MDIQELISQGEKLFGEKKYSEAIEKFNEALDSISDKTKQIQEQVNIQFWIGRCYLEQAIKASDTQTATSLFDKAIEHNQERLQLATQLTDEQKRIEEQGAAQSWLGRCYLEQAIKTSDQQTVTSLFDKAIEHFTQWFELSRQLNDEQNSIEQQIHAQSWLGGAI